MGWNFVSKKMREHKQNIVVSPAVLDQTLFVENNIENISWLKEQLFHFSKYNMLVYTKSSKLRTVYPITVFVMLLT